MRIIERKRRALQKKLGIPKWNGPRNPIAKQIQKEIGLVPLATTKGLPTQRSSSNLAQMVQFIRKRKQITIPITALAGAKTSSGYRWLLFGGIVESRWARERIVFYD